MTSPCVSNYAFDLAVIAVIFATFGLFALVYACLLIRQSVIGRRLLALCGGDYERAHRIVTRVGEVVSDRAAAHAYRRASDLKLLPEDLK